MNFKKFTCLVSFLSTTKTLNTLNIAFITLQWHQKNQSRRSIVSSKTKQNKSRIRQPFKIMMKKAFASNELSDWNTQKQSWCIQVFWILLLFFSLIALVFYSPCICDGTSFSSIFVCFIMFGCIHYSNGLLHLGIGRRLQFVFITCDMHNFIRIQPFFSLRFCLSSAFRSFFHNSHSSSVSVVYSIFFLFYFFHKLFFTKIIHRTNDNKNEKKLYQSKVHENGVFVETTSKMLRKASRNWMSESIGCYKEIGTTTAEASF